MHRIVACNLMCHMLFVVLFLKIFVTNAWINWTTFQISTQLNAVLFYKNTRLRRMTLNEDWTSYGLD